MQIKILDFLATFSSIANFKGQPITCVTSKSIEKHIKTMEHKKPTIEIDPIYLKWEPPKKTPKMNNNN
jgi:hypothetical protein